MIFPSHALLHVKTSFLGAAAAVIADIQELSAEDVENHDAAVHLSSGGECEEHEIEL